MRKITILSLATLLLCLCQSVFAIPAKPGKVLYTQPDGSTIYITVHGDEWFHYATDENGQILEENTAGYLVKSKSTLAQMRQKAAAVKLEKKHIMEMKRQALFKAQSMKKVSGSPKIPVALVEFSDVSFQIENPREAFSRMLNENGYSENGATGSVLDYYQEQSRGEFSPEFIVSDVIKLDYKMSEFGFIDELAAVAVYMACQQVDPYVDFSQFDNDSDGVVDMILMYYAGYNEAEGGPAASIWPHQFFITALMPEQEKLDGVILDRYFCTSELKGYSGVNMCGIGTTCHEFAHSLGLPDMYDTNYNNEGDGLAGATYNYDLMSSGSYNNDSRTPPWLNAEELIMLGWMDQITEISGEGDYTLPSIGAQNPAAFKMAASDEGEYFLLECRPSSEWDFPLEGGLLVYHVDKAPSHTIQWGTENSRTAYELWADWGETNAINCNGSHPCFYIVPSGDPESLNYSGSRFTYPGFNNTSSLIPIDWSGSDTGKALTKITFDQQQKTVQFSIIPSGQIMASGKVYDINGNPIAGALVTISPMGAPAKAPASPSSLYPISKARYSNDKIISVLTDENGNYDIILQKSGAYIIQAQKSGYNVRSVCVNIEKTINQSICLVREDEQIDNDVYSYFGEHEWEYVGATTISKLSYMGANYYTPANLAPYVGKKIMSVSFTVGGDQNTTGTAHAIVDFGNERVACVKAENPVMNDWTTVDLSDKNLVIPDNTGIYAGFAIKDWTYSFPLIAALAGPQDTKGANATYNLDYQSWSTVSYVFKIKLTVGDYDKPDLGFNFINDPNDGVYSIGDTFRFSLIRTDSENRPSSDKIQWFFDEDPIEAQSVTLRSAGIHSISAEFTTVKGEKKVVDLYIHVH